LETFEIEEYDSNNIIKLNREDYKLLEKFNDRINVQVDPKTGIITISSQMPDAQASAEIVKNSVMLLTEYVTNYKISKAQQNLNFIQNRFDESKNEFIKVQEQLASFSDKNRNVVSAMAQTELNRLQNQYDIAFEVYKELASQMEQAKIRVKEVTPVFIVLEPVVKPVEKSKPKRLYILVGFTLLGGLTGLLIIFIKYLSLKYRKFYE
jgi:uncharacterized protein involved in exopolysaccharide biosynthesis